MTPPIALTIAAHDPLGGAGLAADLTTFAAFGVHGMSAISAVTAQHLDSVDNVSLVDSDLVAQQLDGILDEVRPAAVKTGLLGSAIVVTDLARRVSNRELAAPVVDPVMVDGRGTRIVSSEVEEAYRRDLFPVARIITPNLAEAALLVGADLHELDDVISAAPRLAALGPELVVVTGGGVAGGDAVDVIVNADGSTALLQAARSSTDNVRGSGCTFAAAIAASLARGLGPIESAHEAKRFATSRISDSAGWTFAPGKAGPVSHLFAFGG